MCRYAMSGPYKKHYACFSCRKAFKQPPIIDFLESQGLGYVYQQLQLLWMNKRSLELREQELGHRLSDLEESYQDATRKCPECGNEMIDLGLDFKPPRQNDEKAWRTIHGMFRVGHAFHTCGCNGPGYIPKSTNEYDEYLTSKKRHYENELALVYMSPRLTSDARKEAAEFWARGIEAIEREQKNVR